jgi:hypothetical protein
VRRLVAWLIATAAVLILLTLVVVIYAFVHARFGLIFALCAVGLTLSLLLPAGEVVRKARVWRWLAGDE